MADSGHYFQTDSSLEADTRRAQKSKNKNGRPVKLPSKLLALQSDPWNEGRVFVAEAAATVKRVSLENREVEKTFSGPAAPLTSMCTNTPTKSLFAGCWDKNVWRFPTDDSSTNSTTPPMFYDGHTDFIKCILIVPLANGTSLLISGGADGLIMFWSPTTPPADRSTKPRALHTLNPQSRSIESLALDPYSDASSPTIYFSTSTRLISSFSLPSAWKPIPHLKTTSTASLESSLHLLIHETSVYQLHFDHNADLWSCSADKTAKHCPRLSSEPEPSPSSPSSPQSPIFDKPDTTLHHPDFVRSILTTDPSTCGYFHAITACRDENVRVWNASTGDLLHVYSGHYDEVTSLCLVNLPSLPDSNPTPTTTTTTSSSSSSTVTQNNERKQLFVASASIDGTIRTWDVSPPGVSKAKEDEEAAASAVGDGHDETYNANSAAIGNTETKTDHTSANKDTLRTNEFGLTAEEEAELRSMMEDEQDDSLEKQVKGEQ